MTAQESRYAAAASRRRATLRRTALILDGGFLVLAGGLQLVLEVAGHFWHAGPYAATFGSSPYTIGFVEAHGLAVLIGLLLFRAALRESTPFWHGCAAAVHVLLGGANLLFWDSFVTFGLRNAGRAATVLHLLFIVAQSACYLSFDVRSPSYESEV